MRQLVVLSLALAAGTAAAAGNPVHEQFAALSADERGERIARMLATRGQACPSVQREMLQGQLPDGLALWSFSCVAGADYQLIIFPSKDIQLLPCADVAKNPKLLACFTPLPRQP